MPWTLNTPETRRQWGSAFNILQENKFKPRILYPVKLYLKDICRLQGLKKFTSHASFLRKLQEDVYHLSKKVNQNQKQQQQKRKHGVQDTGVPVQERHETGPLDGDEGRSQEDSCAHQQTSPDLSRSEDSRETSLGG